MITAPQRNREMLASRALKQARVPGRHTNLGLNPGNIDKNMASKSRRTQTP
jgi:hypothetical protein